METKIELQQHWGARSVSYWITLFVALAIIFIGARFMMQPQIGAIGYGIPFSDVQDAVYGQVKGIRDIFSGIALIPLLLFRMRRATAWVFTASIMIPFVDFLIIRSVNGPADVEHLLIHGLTALLMMGNSFLLFYKRKTL